MANEPRLKPYFRSDGDLVWSRDPETGEWIQWEARKTGETSADMPEGGQTWADFLEPIMESYYDNPLAEAFKGFREEWNKASQGPQTSISGEVRRPVNPRYNTRENDLEESPGTMHSRVPEELDDMRARGNMMVSQARNMPGTPGAVIGGRGGSLVSPVSGFAPQDTAAVEAAAQASRANRMMPGQVMSQPLPPIPGTNVAPPAVPMPRQRPMQPQEQTVYSMAAQMGLTPEQFLELQRRKAAAETGARNRMMME